MDQAQQLRIIKANRQVRPLARVITVTSGKGGVGKSLLSANLAITLGKAGKASLIIKDWKNEEYDPGMTFTFKDSEVEVLETVQEEVDNIDHEAVRRQVAAAEDAKYQQRRKQRMKRKERASRGSRYQKRYF